MSFFAKSRTRGQSLVELLAGLMVLIPIFLFCIDVVTLYMGVTLNASVCRDAARAASLGAPNVITAGEPQRRAESVVRKSYKATGALRIDPNVVVTENVSPPIPKAPYGGPIAGDVTVTTTVAVYPPFLISMFCGAGGIRFTTNQTFPYTWVMPPT